MITIVIPTMWRYAPFLNFLKYAIKLDIIDQAIIINNDNTKTPNDSVLNNTKIQLVDFGKNIYVNPAWNFGVNASKTNHICIANDDILFDIRLFYKIEEFVNDTTGVIGLSRGAEGFGQTPITTGEIEFEEFNGQSCYGFGELMFVQKKFWRDIPAGLDIGFGDNFIFDYNYFSGRKNYLISNMFHHHAVSQTTNSLPESVRYEFWQRETKIYEDVKSKIIHKTLD